MCLMVSVQDRLCSYPLYFINAALWDLSTGEILVVMVRLENLELHACKHLLGCISVLVHLHAIVSLVW